MTRKHKKESPAVSLDTTSLLSGSTIAYSREVRVGLTERVQKSARPFNSEERENLLQKGNNKNVL